MNKSDPLWVNGTCDRIMKTLQRWILSYYDGVVSATCKRNSKPGPQGIVIEEVITRRACWVAWQQNDLDYFIKILEAKIPTNPNTLDLRRNFPLWKNGRIIPNNAGHETRAVLIPIYEEDLKGLYHLMEALYYGKYQEEKPDLTSVDLSSFK